MNKFVKGLLYTIIYLLMSFFMVAILALLNVSAAYAPIAFICPAVIIFLYVKRNSFFNRKQIGSSGSSAPTRILSSGVKRERLPNAKKSKDIADTLIAEALESINCAYVETSISRYFFQCDRASEKLRRAIKYEEKAGYTYIEKPSYLLSCFENEFQWKLRDAIEREETNLIEEILGPQRNNKHACCQQYLEEIQYYKDELSEETLEFAMKAYRHVCSIAGLNAQTSFEENEMSPMEFVDKMEGYEFEYYCADILSKNGFNNVNVTKKSGDQGIDILAEKDDIKYAIQCKCYSSDLGNKPVQEAFAGKTIYNCQVAAVLTNRFFTQSGIDAAKATGVLLWDRKKLQFFIDSAR